MGAAAGVAFDLLRRFWPILLVAAVGLILNLKIVSLKGELAAAELRAANSHTAFVLEKAAFRETVANYRGTAATARAADLDHARKVEQRDAGITRENQDALTKQRDAALALAADHSRRLQPGASGSGHRGDGGAADMPGAADAALAAAGAGQAPVVAADDAACGEAVIKAQGWQDWWRAIGAAEQRAGAR